MIQKPKEPDKKAYRQPALRVYGGIEVITGHSGMHGPKADGGKGNTKTH